MVESAMKPLTSYHLVWLAAHPYRSEAWLRERFADGFDVHHIDGDKGNEDPGNLVLIDHADHMMLHGMGCKLHRLNGGKRSGPSKRKQRALTVYNKAWNETWG